MDAHLVLIATHSPILLAYPEAGILSFDGGHIHEIGCRESQPCQLVSRFVASREQDLNALFPILLTRYKQTGERLNYGNGRFARRIEKWCRYYLCGNGVARGLDSYFHAESGAGCGVFTTDAGEGDHFF